MNLSSSVWSFVAGLVVIAIVATLVRPGSGAATAVKDIGAAIAALLQAAVA